MAGIRRIFIANRGEIALRIIRTCRELGIETVLGVSAADVNSLPARFATNVVVIGPERAADSYLDAALNVHCAKASECDALHPGFGFLAENPRLAELCEQYGIVFIGPSAQCLGLLGDKMQARELAASLGLPVLAGGHVASLETALTAAKKIGYPLMLKASAGGGGRGIRVIDDAECLQREFDTASAEAASSFGDGRLHIETFVDNARHVEVQVLGARDGVVTSFGERDCSVQYNYQKMIEEAPCPVLDDEHRSIINGDAVKLISSQDYVGLGTVEFLFEPGTGRHFFLEVNPRIQVEHPVTEMVTARDLVADQIRVAEGETLPELNQKTIVRGHAIECRINAQDPENRLIPSPGRIDTWLAPAGPFVRIDSHCFAGYLVPPYYDSMLAKLIVWGPDRDTALSRARRSVDEFVVTGTKLKTNLPLLSRLLQHADFCDAGMPTTWLGSLMNSQDD
jgi:acetyl-CoA carboxylase biotin carboxylase subunit